MEIFSLYPKDGQSLFIDLKRFQPSEKKAAGLFADGPIEILFCRVNNNKVVLSVKAPSEFDIFLSDPVYGGRTG